LVAAAVFGDQDWPIVGREEEHTPLSATVMTVITLAVVAAGIAIAVLMYRRDIPREAPAGSPITTFRGVTCTATR